MEGIGDTNSQFVVYLGNRPDFADLATINHVRPVNTHEIADIGNQCGNGWRKVFNVYAKLIYAMQARMHCTAHFNSWQAWRDEQLLRADSNSLLLFSPPILAELNGDKIHVLMGKGWAAQCGLNEQLFWLNQDFAIINKQNFIVCPYFDYRQLNNQKILYLCELLKPMLARISN